MTDGETSAEAELSPGTQVGEYRIEGKLGAGGFGAVYRGVHPVIGKPAAIKVLNREYSANPNMVARFIDEARAVNQIRHRNIIDIFSFGALDDGRQFFVMELLEGHTLEAHLKRHGALDVADALRILKPVARALAAAHDTGIFHRDLKPENIFLSFDDEGQVFPKLLDFGIAKLMGESARMTSKTRTGTPMGTPLYMSPEQCRGIDIDHRTDIYSFGIVAYQMLTGQVPFDGETAMDVMLAQTAQEAVAMTGVRPSLPVALDPPVLAMLHKEAQARPARIDTAYDALVSAAASAGVTGITPIGAATSGRGTTGPYPSKPQLTPDQQHLSEAATLAGDEVGDSARAISAAVPTARSQGAGAGSDATKTFQGAEADVPPATTRRAAVIVGALALAGGIAAAVAFSGKLSAVEDPKTSAVRDAPTETAEPEASAAGSAMEVEPADPAPAPEPKPKNVEITLQTSLAGVEIFVGDEKIGDVDNGAELPVGTDPVELRLQKAGYQPKTVTITPEADIVLPVELSPLPAQVALPPSPPPAAPPPISDELEF